MIIARYAYPTFDQPKSNSKSVTIRAQDLRAFYYGPTDIYSHLINCSENLQLIKKDQFRLNLNYDALTGKRVHSWEVVSKDDDEEMFLNLLLDFREF